MGRARGAAHGRSVKRASRRNRASYTLATALRVAGSACGGRFAARERRLPAPGNSLPKRRPHARHSPLSAAAVNGRVGCVSPTVRAISCATSCCATISTAQRSSVLWSQNSIGAVLLSGMDDTRHWLQAHDRSITSWCRAGSPLRPATPLCPAPPGFRLRQLHAQLRRNVASLPCARSRWLPNDWNDVSWIAEESEGTSTRGSSHARLSDVDKTVFPCDTLLN